MYSVSALYLPADLPGHHSVLRLRGLPVEKHKVAVVAPFEKCAKALGRASGRVVAADMECVNATIISRTGSEVTMVPEVAHHQFRWQGRGARRLWRWRSSPAMAARAISSSPPQSNSCTPRRCFMTMSWTRANCGAAAPRDDAAGVRSERARRRLPAPSARHSRRWSKSELKALEILSSAASVIAEGEVMQLAVAKNTATTEDVLRRSAARPPNCSRRPARLGRRSAPQKAEQVASVPSDESRTLTMRRLWRRVGASRQECRRRFPRGQDHAAGGARLPPRHRHRARILAAQIDAARPPIPISIMRSGSARGTAHSKTRSAGRIIYGVCDAWRCSDFHR